MQHSSQGSLLSGERGCILLHFFPWELESKHAKPFVDCITIGFFSSGAKQSKTSVFDFTLSMLNTVYLVCNETRYDTPDFQDFSTRVIYIDNQKRIWLFFNIMETKLDS